jgi:hypothetical protein
MDYLLAILALVILVPLIFIFLGRRARGGDKIQAQRDHGVTFAEPSSDQPSGGADATVNPSTPEVERRLPPG